MVLEYQGYSVQLAPSGEEGLDFAAVAHPDLAILDINLPGIDGIETCRRLRTRGYDGPVLMLTARQDVRDRVSGLDAGADDYLPKPFALAELLARVRALLRRTGSSSPSLTESALRLADLTVDRAARTVLRGDTNIELTKIEFDLLELFITNVNIVLTREVIQERIWGYDDELGSNSLEVFVSSLRRKTEPDDAIRLIHTVRGVGYVARHGS